MKTRLPIGIAALLLGAGLQGAAAQDLNGEQIFTETCAACHGAESELSAATLGSLDEVVFREALAGHPEVGGAVAELSDDQIGAIHAYVAEQAEG